MYPSCRRCYEARLLIKFGTQAVRERVEGKLGMREAEEPSVLSPLSGGDKSVKASKPIAVGAGFGSTAKMGTMWGRRHVVHHHKPGSSVMSIWHTLADAV